MSRVDSNQLGLRNTLPPAMTSSFYFGDLIPATPFRRLAWLIVPPTCIFQTLTPLPVHNAYEDAKRNSRKYDSDDRPNPET